jgi:hypothetical protein
MSFPRRRESIVSWQMIRVIGLPPARARQDQKYPPLKILPGALALTPISINTLWQNKKANQEIPQHSSIEFIIR